MDEAEWLASEDPRRLLGFLDARRSSPRKLRLFICASHRQGIHLPADEERLRTIELAERYADGELWVGSAMVSGDQVALASEVLEVVALEEGWSAGRRASLIRDIFGNPFRPLPPPGRRAAGLWERELQAALRWNGGVISDLARAAYEDRILPTGILRLDRLAVLADALEEVGCTNVAILEHLREPGPHVRGCWLLDLLLQKEPALHGE
jgi:hypothetical protein